MLKKQAILVDIWEVQSIPANKLGFEDLGLEAPGFEHLELGFEDFGLEGAWLQGFVPGVC